MIRLELQPEIESQLATEARARGLALERYIEQIVEGRPVERSAGEQKAHSIGEAIDRLLELRDGTNLGGLSIKDLINEGRKH